ncbi:16953_t:CDS:2 [Racocetra fulgida]|uniref:16953_t:CDS:1 n=1 Tax=Racocetra fulgida TaxID=60492 RepID=A0A9N9A8Z6_9GLOM|nr:16953_t:CDS:2 [Racocetra fulgida]
MKNNNFNEITTIPEPRIQNPSANETIVDIQSKLHQLVAKKHQKNNSDPKLDTSSFKSNSAPNLPIHRSSTITHIQTSSQRQSKGSLRSGHSSLSLSSGSNNSEHSTSRHNTSRKNSIQGNPLGWNVEQNDITGDILLGLDLDSLKELNIMSYGKRIHIMNAINALKCSSTLNKDQGNVEPLQLHPIMESTPITQLNSVDISDKVDTKDEASLVNSNGNSNLPQQTDHIDEKVQVLFSEKLINELNQINRLDSVKESTGEEDEEILKDIGTPDYEGWLMKQDDKYKSWKNRFCVLRKQTLFYFQSDKGKYGFKLVHDTERAHYFAHENLGKIREWMKAIMKATISRDLTSPVFSSSDLSTMSLAEARKLVHKQPKSTNKNSEPPEGSDSPTLERSLSPTLYPPSNNFNRSNPQQPSPRCRSVSPLPEIPETSGQSTTMTSSKSKISTFKKLVKSTSFDSITASYM